MRRLIPCSLAACACVFAVAVDHASADEPAAASGEPEASEASASPANAELPPEADAGEAPAEPAKPSGLTLGARLSLGVPLGTTSGTVGGGTDPQSDSVTVAFPLWLEAGYRFARHFFVGGYGVFGLATVPNGCPTAICYDLRLGAEAQYHGRGNKTDPWIGAGFGYEFLHTGTRTLTMAYRGWELLNLQGGIDWHVSRVFDLGPFMAVSFGEYTSVREIGGGLDTSTSLPNKGIHEWVELGIRGEYDL